MKISTTLAGVKSILGALEHVSHCLPSFKLLGDPLIDIIKVETNKDFTPSDIHQPFIVYKKRDIISEGECTSQLVN